MSDLLVPAALVEAARTATGLDDFGSDSYREGLAVYCGALQSEAELNEIGTYALHGNMVGRLSNRLRVVDWINGHPEVGREVIEAPVVVIGLFRAGTTLLSELLELGPDTRSLLGWEAADSAPPPTPANYREGERLGAARAQSAMLDQLNPELKKIHHEEPDGPTECITLLSQDFKALLWESIANVPSYGRWLLETDHESAYLHHRQCLQVLQSAGVSGRWCLKSPHHAIALEALTVVYPDARLVYLHRDPVSVAASACSLIGCLTGTFSDADHRAYIARRWTDVLVESVRRVDEFRDRNPVHPVLDLQYADLLAAPAETLASVYAFAGLDYAAAVDQTARDYMAAHPRGRFGVHHHDATQLGLNRAELRERFAPYVERYGVAPES